MLTSWATPAASVPTEASRSAWSSRASISRRSLTSTSSALDELPALRVGGDVLADHDPDRLAVAPAHPHLGPASVRPGGGARREAARPVLAGM